MAMKPWYASRTLWFGVAVALIGFLEQLQTIQELPPSFVSGVGVMIIALRLLTRYPVRR